MLGPEILADRIHTLCKYVRSKAAFTFSFVKKIENSTAT